MKTVTGAMCLVCASLFLASVVHGDDAPSFTGIVESLRAKAAAMDSSIKDMEQQLEKASEIRAAIDAEIERLKPLVALGGYIPCPDHRIAPDAKWDLVRYYCDCMRQEFG